MIGYPLVPLMPLMFDIAKKHVAGLFYSATFWTFPPARKWTFQNENRDHRILLLFVNRSIMLEKKLPWTWNQKSCRPLGKLSFFFLCLISNPSKRILLKQVRQIVIRPYFMISDFIVNIDLLTLLPYLRIRSPCFTLDNWRFDQSVHIGGPISSSGTVHACICRSI